MRAALSLLAGTVGVLLAGCAVAQPQAQAPGNDVRPARASLIFDTVSTAYQPDQYSLRNPWPRATTYQSEGEVIAYRELLYDRQGNHRLRDYFTRRFIQVREGLARR